MSSNNISRPTINWRQREQERDAARKAAERKAIDDADRKKFEKTDNNFPTLTTSTRPAYMAAAGNKFASLAEKWARDKEVEDKMKEMRRLRDEADQRESAAIKARSRMYAPSSGRDDYYEEADDYEYDNYKPTAPISSSNLGAGLQNESLGWTEVSRKAIKTNRDMTIEQMDAREYRLREMNDINETEFNGDLFDSKRHDHDRV